MMRTIALMTLIALAAVPAFADSKKCEDCPPDKPCVYTVKMNCNTGSGSAYCVDGVWYGGIQSVTAMNCGPPQIVNPFEFEGMISGRALVDYKSGEAIKW